MQSFIALPKCQDCVLFFKLSGSWKIFFLSFLDKNNIVSTMEKNRCLGIYMYQVYRDGMQVMSQCDDSLLLIFCILKYLTILIFVCVSVCDKPGRDCLRSSLDS